MNQMPYVTCTISQVTISICDWTSSRQVCWHPVLGGSSVASQQSHTPSPTAAECSHLLVAPLLLHQNRPSGHADVPARTNETLSEEGSGPTWFVVTLRAIAVVVIHLCQDSCLTSQRNPSIQNNEGTPWTWESLRGHQTGRLVTLHTGTSLLRTFLHLWGIVNISIDCR